MRNGNVIGIPTNARKAWLWLFLITLVSTLALGFAKSSAAGPDPSTGEALFQQKCAACHSIGGGDRVGPDLKGVMAQRDRQWLTQFILAPDKVLAQKDPIATALLKKYNNIPMPNLGLTEVQVAAILSYLDTTASPAALPTSQPSQVPSATVTTPAPTSTTVSPLQPPPPTQSASPIVAAATSTPSKPPATERQTPATAPAQGGDPVIGKDLFTGQVRFKSGMTPCIACHGAAGIGPLGGGAMGPDLTQAYTKFGGDAGITGLLANIPFPAMKALFGDKLALTPREQADLKAFLKEASASKRPAGSVGWLALFGVVGAGVGIGTAGLVWRQRLLGVRRSLRPKK